MIRIWVSLHDSILNPEEEMILPGLSADTNHTCPSPCSDPKPVPCMASKVPVPAVTSAGEMPVMTGPLSADFSISEEDDDWISVSYTFFIRSANS